MDLHDLEDHRETLQLSELAGAGTEGAPRTRIAASELRRRVNRPVDGVFLLQPRSLSRIILAHRNSSILAASVPEVEYYLLEREPFLAALEEENPDALTFIEGIVLPEIVIVLPMPTETMLRDVGADRLLLRAWAARVEAEAARTWHLERDRRRDEKTHGHEALTELVGEVAMREIEAVQRRDHRVLDTPTRAELVRSFVGTAVRLGLFQKSWRSVFFPAIESWPEVEAWIARGGIDPLAIMEKARPLGLIGDPARVEAEARGRDGVRSSTTRRPPIVLDRAAQSSALSASTSPGEAGATTKRTHPRAWRNARPQSFDRRAADARRAVAEAVALDRVDAEAVRRRSLAVDLLVAFLEWVRSTFVLTLFGGLCRRVATRSDLALAGALATHGLAARWHCHAAARAQARGNAAEVLRRLHEAGWHYHILSEGQPEGVSDPFLERLRSQRADQVALISERFARSFGVGDPQRESIAMLVTALGDPSIAGERRLKGRLLKDLYKAALDVDRAFARIQLVLWVASFGTQPLRQPLPYHPRLRALRQLKAAGRKLATLPWPVNVRERLAAPLAAVRARLAEDLRASLRPILVDSIKEAHLVPATRREELALAKTCNELLDTLLERWHLRFTDLRDAIARNDLRLHDLSAQELMRGDELTRLNRLLALRLVGTYERAELYIQVLQRMSAILFGTPYGRVITRYALIPFIGAYMVVMGFAHLFDPVSGFFDGPQLQPYLTGHAATPQRAELPDLSGLPLGVEVPEFAAEAAGITGAPPPLAPPGAGGHYYLPHAVTVLAFALLAAIYTRIGRRIALASWRLLVDVLRVLVLAPYRILWAWQPLQQMLKTRAARRFSRYLMQPFLLGLILASPFLILDGLRASSEREPWWPLAGGFIVGLVLVNTKTGRGILDTGAYRLGDFWSQVKYTFFVGIFQLVMDLSDHALAAVEQVFYRVDDLLRFREGEGTLAIIVKGIAQIAWSAVTFVTRIYVNLLIEPQVNPIKHFPVVTVTHKLMLPWVVMLTQQLHLVLGSLLLMPAWLSWPISTITIFLLPGFFGFLVWELKENWKLFRANHAAAIRPVVVGSHGETCVGMMRRGFHSGTIPKAFDKMCSALRASRLRDVRHRLHLASARLHHCERDISTFVERELMTAIKLDPILARGFPEVTQVPVRLATESLEVGIELGRRPQAASGTGATVRIEIDYAMRDHKLHAKPRLSGLERAELDESECKALATELGAFLERSAATFDPAELELDILRSLRADQRGAPRSARA